MSEALQEELEQIIQNEKDIIPFLKALEPKEKKALFPAIKERISFYHEQKQVDKKVIALGSFYTQTSFEYIHSEKKRSLIDKAYFVCATNKKDFFDRPWLRDLIRHNYFEEILSWYVPKWLQQFLEDNEVYYWSYDDLLRFEKAGIFNPTKRQYAHVVSGLISEYAKDNGEYNYRTIYYTPENLNKHPEILNKHIWYLFETDSNLTNTWNNHSKVINFEGKETLWEHTLLTIMNEGTLERERLISSCVLTHEKEISKGGITWFYKFLKKLKPTSKELLNHQEEFMLALRSEHNGVVSAVLGFLKSIASEKTFNWQEFVEHAPVLLGSTVKTNNNATIMALEKIVKTFPGSKQPILDIICTSFQSRDSKIQERVAKFILNHSEVSDESVQANLNVYKENILHDVKMILADYFDGAKNEIVEEVDIEIEVVSVLDDIKNINIPSTFDDMVFFLSQSLDNNKPYHVELAASILPALHALVSRENIHKLEPMIQRAIKYVFNLSDWNTRTGNFEFMLASLLKDYAMDLRATYTSAFQGSLKYRSEKIKEAQENKWTKESMAYRKETLNNQGLPDHIYYTLKVQLLIIKDLIKLKKSLPLISVPSHEPAWLSPKVLLERLKMYKDQDANPNSLDLQLAICRLPWFEKIDLSESELENVSYLKVKEALLYLFKDRSFDENTIAANQLLQLAILSKNNQNEIQKLQTKESKIYAIESGIKSWGIINKKYFEQIWDPFKSDLVDSDKVKYRIILDVYPNEKMPKLLSQLKDRFKKWLPSKPDYQFLYDSFKVSKKSFEPGLVKHDEQRFLSYTPNQFSPVLELAIKEYFPSSTMTSENAKKSNAILLELLIQLWKRKEYDEVSYLYVACCLMCNHQVSKDLAGELWIQASSKDQMNNVLLGSIMGILFRDEYAPLKRFGDLMSNNLVSISGKLDKSLLILLENMISQMNVKAPRNGKKILEVFHELKQKTKQKSFGQDFYSALEAWKSTKSLHTLIKKIVG